ncbi:unnamed protein product [Boreogadus saida]
MIRPIHSGVSVEQCDPNCVCVALKRPSPKEKSHASVAVAGRDRGERGRGLERAWVRAGENVGEGRGERG